MTLYYKIRGTLLQIATAILLRNATKVYYKMRQFYQKMCQFLQNATLLLQNTTFIQNAMFITKCVSTLTLIKVRYIWKDVQEDFYSLFFCGVVKLTFELWHKFFINLRFRQILNLRRSTLFYNNLPSATPECTHSAVCGRTYISSFGRY